MTLLLMLLAAPAAAQEWTRFRGPNGTGFSDAATVPARWTESDYNWKVELPGVGISSPVLWGERIFITSALEDTATRIVLCLDAADGKTLWEQRYQSKVHPKHQLNSFASATPTVDEDHVYVVWTTPEENTLTALEHDGREAWQVDLGPYIGEHSSGASPIVYDDLVILANDQGLSRDNPSDVASSLLAVDRHKGKVRWQVERRTEFAAYSTPCVYQPDDGPPQLIFNSGAHGITSIDPKTGGTNWEIDVLDKRSVSSPIVAGGLIIGTTGSGGGGNYMAAVRPPGAGRGTPLEAYRISDAAPYVPTPVAHGELVFLWSDKGIVSCIRAESGEVLWRQRLGGNFFGSPVCVGGRLYCTSDEGEVDVVAAAEKFELLGRNPLGEGSRSTPAVAGGRMYLRTFSHLISIGGK